MSSDMRTTLDNEVWWTRGDTVTLSPGAGTRAQQMLGSAETVLVATTKEIRSLTPIRGRAREVLGPGGLSAGERSAVGGTLAGCSALGGWVGPRREWSGRW